MNPQMKWVCSECDVPLTPVEQKKGKLVTTRGRLITERYECPRCHTGWTFERGTYERLHEGIWKPIETTEEDDIVA